MLNSSELLTSVVNFVGGPNRPYSSQGETETGALSEWFPKSAVGQGKTFADLNLVSYWVGGKTNFAFYMHFLSEFGVPWVVICDGDALPVNKDRNCQLWEALKDL